MNGFRRLLDVATGSSTTPSTSPITEDFPNLQQQAGPSLYSTKSGPSWPPPSPPTSLPGDQLSAATKEKPQPPIPKTNDVVLPMHVRNKSSTSTSTSSSSSMKPNGNRESSPTLSSYIGSSRPVTRKSVPKLDNEQDWRRSSTPLNTRDELLVSLLASEAVVECRDFDILTSEEVEELKKEHQVLQSRLVAATKKLALETKIRDAARSLVKVNAANKKVSKKSEEQLEGANKRVEVAQADFSRISQRASEVLRHLTEHRAGVLSLSVRRMEKKMAPKGADSGYNSPIHSATPLSAASPRFDGAHLFAGHADALVPKRQVTPDAAAAEILALETKLKAATAALTAAGKKQAEMQRDLSVLRLEKQEVETSMTLELQSAEETISALEQELPRLENLEQQHLEEKNQWEQERERLVQQCRRAKELEAQNGNAELAAERSRSEEKERDQRDLKQKGEEVYLLEQTLEQERKEWERERARMQDEKMEDLARLHDEMERQREDDLAILKRAGEELEDGLNAIQIVLETYGVLSRDASLPGMIEAISSYIQKLHTKVQTYEQTEEEWSILRRKLEDDIRNGLDKRESLQRELEEARRARDTVTLELNKRLNESPALPPAPLPPIEINVPLETDVAKVTSILLPVWAMLPSPEARAAKVSASQQRSLYGGSPTSASSSSSLKSIADLDVRSLKTLYDSSRAGSPQSGAGGAFSFEAFAGRVQALIADDRSLIERLIRFAQAHDLLRKNAERAQKLAQDGATSLETYQKQVWTLEERNEALMARVIELQAESQYLQETLEQLSMLKEELEAHAADQAEELRELTEANHALSARTLTLAEEAASGPEKVRKQLELQLNEYRGKLEAAQAELSAMQNLEQTQRIALMDELNSVQTENDRLRGQLRSIKR